MTGSPNRIGLFKRFEQEFRLRRKLAAAWWRLKTQKSAVGADFRAGSPPVHGGKTILFIDVRVLTPDQDAGSRSVMCYLEFFRKQGWSVKFLADDFVSAQPHTRRLQDLGVEVLAGDYFFLNWKAWLKQNGSILDCVFITRSQIAEKWADRLRVFTSAPILLYGHDVFSRTLARAGHDLADPQLTELLSFHEQYEQSAIPSVDFVFYPSDEEVQWLKLRYPGKPISRIPLYALSPPVRNESSPDSRHGLLFVGGMAHRPNSDAVLWFVQNAWPKISLAWPEAIFHVAGSHPTNQIRALASDRIHIHGQLSEEVLASLHQQCRLSVAPLRYGGGIKGKILQAMHLGLPVVTTPIGAEGLKWQSPTMLVCELEDFASGVCTLYGGARRWRELRLNAWDFLEAEYGNDALRSALEPILGRLA